MGRIVDLCGEVAASADEGPEGLILPPEAWDRLRDDWDEEDIEDALGFVRDSLLQGELVDAADSLSSHLVEALGKFGEAKTFDETAAGHGEIGIELVQQLAHRVERLEEILEAYREGRGPNRLGFDALRRRLLDLGIESEMGTRERDDEEDKREDEE
jgi:hypothetical protein